MIDQINCKNNNFVQSSTNNLLNFKKTLFCFDVRLVRYILNHKRYIKAHQNITFLKWKRGWYFPYGKRHQTNLESFMESGYQYFITFFRFFPNIPRIHSLNPFSHICDLNSCSKLFYLQKSSTNYFAWLLVPIKNLDDVKLEILDRYYTCTCWLSIRNHNSDHA